MHAVEAIYQAAAEPTHWPVALQKTADCLGDVGAILLYGKDDGSFGALNSASLDSVVAEYARDWSFRDIRAVRSRERGYFFKRDVITDRDVVTPQEIESDPFYSEFLHKRGLKYFAAAMVSPDARIEVALSIQRAIGHPEYSEAELDIVAQLGKHVERSLRLGIRLIDTGVSNIGLGAALARIGIGVFILDSIGRVIFSNPKTLAVLGDGLDIIDDRLVVGSLALNAPAARAMKQAVTDPAAGFLASNKSIPVHRRSSSRPLILHVLPIAKAATATDQFLAQARMIILVLDPDHDTQPDPTMIRDVLGLTLGEARLTSLVGTGRSPREAAAQLGITEATARTILKRVFAKVGVSRQGELASLMARLLLK